MADFKTTVTAVDNMFKSKSIYATWVKFSMGRNGSLFSIDTASSNNNYFISLENVKNGSGQANKFTLQIVFVPKILDASGSTDADIIDKSLTFLFKKVKSGDTDTINNRMCYISYGYGSNDVSGFRTVEYEGMVLSYTTEINDGALMYTITGISGLAVSNETLYTFPGSGDELMKPSDEIKRIVNGQDDNGNDYLKGYSFDEKNSICDDLEVKIPSGNNLTVFQYLQSLTDIMRCSTDNDDDIKYVYGYAVSDAKDNKKIYICKMPSSEKPEEEFTFYWMNPQKDGGNIVQDFKTSFDGAVIYSRVAEEFHNIDEDGQIRETSTESQPSVVSLDENEEYISKLNESNLWKKAVNSSYKATLTVLGLPCEIRIGTCIRVVPLILGKPHYTQGLYMITKITDLIDNGGFTTTLDLLRITEDIESIS